MSSINENPESKKEELSEKITLKWLTLQKTIKGKKNIRTR